MLPRIVLLLALVHALAFAVACSGETAAFEPPTQDELDIDALVAGAESGALTSVDDLLLALPAEQRASVVLLERTKSLHRADVEHPRAIFFGPDARLVVAVSTDPEDPRYETAELMEQDEESGEFRLAAITFREEGATVEGDAGCTRCHGQTPRPIWGGYPVWPGAFGEEDNELTAEQRRVLEDASDSGSRLRFARESLGAGYSLAARSYGYPNTSFNFELGPRVATWIVERARESARFERFAPALVALPQCSYVDDERVRGVVSAMRSAVEAEGLGSSGYDWEAIYDLWGLDLARDFAVESRVDQVSVSPDAQLALWNSGAAYLDDLVRFLVLDELAASDAALETILAPASAARSDLLLYGWQLAGAQRAAALADPDTYARAEIDPEARVLSAALGEIDAPSEARVAFCLRLGELWEARRR